ncbi:glycosyl transferase, partial [Azospirillum brasilense]|nr:glycosyl transferase [Azospirillum brasilense]
MRVLFHVQHLLGIGHDRRAALITRGLAEAGVAVTVLRGGHPVPGIDYGPAADIVQLPPARAADGSFKTLLDEHDRPIDDAWRARRRATVLEVQERVRPDALLVESFPFGRRAFRFELLPLLEAAKAAGAVTACSVRDILVTKAKPERLEETVSTVERLFDHVLVHGDPDLIPFAATFPAAARIAERIRYTGYVAAPQGGEGKGADGTGEGIVSVGGGAVGLALRRAGLAGGGSSSARVAAPWRLAAGPGARATEGRPHDAR